MDANTETEILKKAEANNNPITWANLLLYSKYYQPFYDEIKDKVDMIVDREVSKLSCDEYMMQTEFWYILIYHNCPHISSNTQSKINNVISSIHAQASTQMSNMNTIHTGIATDLICDFLCQQSPGGNKPLESFYDWNDNRSISQQITYRTFQRTIFKKYKSNRNSLFTSID